MATNNPIDTPKITLGGPLTISGAFTTTITVTANTNITFPVSGTLLSTLGGVLPLAEGGTNANLIADNGGIVYSNATQLQILGSTATASQVLLSGSSAAPTWSTATYPSTTVINQILYSSAANTISGLATGINGVLITSGAGIPSISSTLPNAVQNNITRLGTVGVVGGALDMTSFQINNLANPLLSTDAANKAYVDSVAGGLVIELACYAATTGNLNVIQAGAGVGATLTDNSGTFAVFSTDGVSPPLLSRILVKDQTLSKHNGIYVLTTNGDGLAIPYVLTRAADYDQPAEIFPGTIAVVDFGTLNAATSWIETATVVTVDTDPILFSPFTLSSGNFLRVVNNLSDVANALTSFNNISPVTTKGDLLTHNGVNNIRLAVGVTDGQILQADSVAASGLAWSTATYPVTTTLNNILFSSSANVVAEIATANEGVLVTDVAGVPSILVGSGVSGQVLQAVNGAAPAWSTPTYPSISGTAGKILRSDGTNNLYSTALYPNTTTVNRILYSSASNTISEIVTANNGVLVTNNTGIPAISTGGQIPGTDTNNNATAGNIGEYIFSNSGAVACASNVPTNMTSIVLTAGDWIVYGNVVVSLSGSATFFSGWITLVSATPPGADLETFFNFSASALSSSGFTVPERRISVAAPTTVYIGVKAVFSSGVCGSSGNIYARRVR